MGVVDVPVNISGDSSRKKNFAGMRATPEEVMTTRLMDGVFSAEVKIPVVPLTAG